MKPIKTETMKPKLLKITITLLAAASVHAEGLTNFFSFTTETKIKGPMTVVSNELYFACEKGGAWNYGYIGKFNPATRTLTVLYEFPEETKVKDGFTLVSNELWFVCEKGGAANFGYLGSFNLASNTVTRLYDFTADIKPKSAPLPLDTNGWYFFAEKAGSHGVGALLRFSPVTGLSTAASFTISTGVKVESRPVWFNGQLYYAAREGGDTTQLGGKGAGAIGTIDLATGTVTKLANLDAANNVAKIRTLLPFNGRLYYTGEEGGDLSLNSGKGFGGLGYYDPTNNSFTRLFVCDASTTGTKPRGLVAVDDRLYFNCGEGGPNGLGTFGVVINGTNAVIVGVNDAVVGGKSDAGLTRFGNFIFFATELGCAHFLGGISAYELPATTGNSAPVLNMTVSGTTLQLWWDSSASDYILEQSTTLTGTWSAITAPGATNASVPMTNSSGFFRLRRY
jgi:uncharacterized repeat protein (TIGR03803 family)